MITPEIISYIKAERAKGAPEPVIQSNLVANGWNSKDISEAIASLAGNGGLIISEAEIKRYRNKRTWITFCILAAADFVAIMLLGGVGLFGVSPLSIVIRIIVIFGISLLTSQGSKPEKEAWKGALSTVLRLIGALILVFVIGVGILFALCYFSLAHSSL